MLNIRICFVAYFMKLASTLCKVCRLLPSNLILGIAGINNGVAISGNIAGNTGAGYLVTRDVESQALIKTWTLILSKPVKEDSVLHNQVLSEMSMFLEMALSNLLERLFFYCEEINIARAILQSKRSEPEKVVRELIPLFTDLFINEYELRMLGQKQKSEKEHIKKRIEQRQISLMKLIFFLGFIKFRNDIFNQNEFSNNLLHHKDIIKSYYVSLLKLCFSMYNIESDIIKKSKEIICDILTNGAAYERFYLFSSKMHTHWKEHFDTLLDDIIKHEKFGTDRLVDMLKLSIKEMQRIISDCNLKGKITNQCISFLQICIRNQKLEIAPQRLHFANLALVSCAQGIKIFFEAHIQFSLAKEIWVFFEEALSEVLNSSLILNQPFMNLLIEDQNIVSLKAAIIIHDKKDDVLKINSACNEVLNTDFMSIELDDDIFPQTILVLLHSIAENILKGNASNHEDATYITVIDLFFRNEKICVNDILMLYWKLKDLQFLNDRTRCREFWVFFQNKVSERLGIASDKKFEIKKAHAVLIAYFMLKMNEKMVYSLETSYRTKYKEIKQLWNPNMSTFQELDYSDTEMS